MEETTNKKRPTFQFWNRARDLKILKRIGVAVIVLASLVIIKDELVWQFDSSTMGDDFFAGSEYTEGGSCNAKGINFHGKIITYIPPADVDEYGFASTDLASSEDIIYYMEQAENDESIKAIILEIDSYGGSPVAGEEVAIALKRMNKPTVALIRAGGVSAAYLAASGADKIFASKNSDVGGIGVTMSYLQNVIQNERDGLSYIPLSSGKFKDTGDPDKPLTEEEYDLLMRDINIIHENFIRLVAENRNIDIEKIERLADGSTMLGEMALQNGLIDQIGGMFEVRDYLKDKIGEEVEICW